MFHRSYYATRIVRPSFAAFIHPATTSAMINGIPEREAHHAYNFWQTLNPRLELIGDEAWCAWANTLPVEALGRDW